MANSSAPVIEVAPPAPASLSLQTNSAEVFKFLNDADTVKTVAFASGLVWASDNIEDAPLWSLFWGSVLGCITSWGAEVVSDIMPAKFRFVIPVSLSLSSVLWIASRSKRKARNRHYSF